MENSQTMLGCRLGLLERAEGQGSHDLSVHLVDKLDRLTDGVVPGLDLPCLVPGPLSLVQGGILPDMEDGVQTANLGEPRTNGLDKLPACLQATPPVLFPFEQVAWLKMVGPQLVETVGGARRRRRPKGEFLGEPVGAVREQRAEAAGELLKIRVGAESGFGLVVARVAVVLPNVVEGLEIADDDFPAACEAHGKALFGKLRKVLGNEGAIFLGVRRGDGLTLDLMDILAAGDLIGMGLGGYALGFGLVRAVEERFEQALFGLLSGVLCVLLVGGSRRRLLLVQRRT